MKIKLYLIGLMACFLSVFSFAKSDAMSYYMVSPEKVEEYEKLDLLKDTVKAFEILDKYRAWFFESRVQMSETIQQELKEFPQFKKIVNNFIQATWILREDESIDKSGMMNYRVWLGDRGLDSLKWYIRNDLKNVNYSKSANKFLEDLQGIIFADTLLAHHYAMSLFAASVGVCNDSVVNRYIKDGDLRWSDDQIKELFGQRKVKLSDFLKDIEKEKKVKKGKKPESDIERVLRFRELYNGRICNDERWKFVSQGLETLYSRSLADLVALSMVKQNTFDEKTPINWKRKKCGCSHKDELNGEVFGIYPYWLANDTTKWIDFEGVTRMAYYGLRATDEGALEMPSGMLAKDYLNDEKNYEFVNEAHRHFVKMDWIVEKDDWNELSKPDALKGFFANLINEIDEILNKKISSSFERFMNMFSIYVDESDFRGDGVTLFFRNYPKTKEATLLFNTFYKQLQTKLSEKNPNVIVNLMMHRLDLSENEHEQLYDSFTFKDNGIYSFANFAKIAINSENKKFAKYSDRGKDLKNYLLVVVEEPVSRSKRLVVSQLNQELNGVDRRNVLHSVVPVLWFDNKQWSQLREDAMYYNDTYYALGIAPYATALQANDSCRVSGNLGMCFMQYFEVENGSGERQSAFSAFVCTHRWLFRLLNFIAFVIAIGLIVSYFVSCRVSDFFNRHLGLLLCIVVLPFGFTMALLLSLDPSVAGFGLIGMSPILVLLAIIIAIILHQVYIQNDLPKRRNR